VVQTDAIAGGQEGCKQSGDWLKIVGSGCPKLDSRTHRPNAGTLQQRQILVLGAECDLRIDVDYRGTS
jgi:hypothetical protein